MRIFRNKDAHSCDRNSSWTSRQVCIQPFQKFQYIVYLCITETELEMTSQMPYPVSITLQFLFGKLCYRFVKLL